MRRRLESSLRLVHLQEQRIRVVETELARLRAELRVLDAEEKRLHAQIESTMEGQSEIIDLLFRRLDQLTRQRAQKQAEIAAVLNRLRQEKMKGEAAERLFDDTKTQVRTEEDRLELLDIVERAATVRGTSFR